MITLISYRYNGTHYHVQLQMGTDREHMQFIGKLVMHDLEFRTFVRGHLGLGDNDSTCNVSHFDTDYGTLCFVKLEDENPHQIPDSPANS